jgi:predicted Zn-dependent protease
LARQYLTEALKLDPYNPYVCHTLSNLELRYNNIIKAREILTVVFERKPTSTICTALADLEQKEGNIGQAKYVLLRGIKLCRGDKSALLLALAWIEENSFDNPTEAYKLIAIAMKQSPGNVRVYVAKANMEMRLNNFAQARETLYSSTKLSSEDGKHFTMLATLELEAGNYREAQMVLQQGVEAYPGDYFLLQRYGDLESKHGSIHKARELFRKAILIQPHTPTFVAWAMLEENLGNLVSFDCFYFYSYHLFY